MTKVLNFPPEAARIDDRPPSTEIALDTGAARSGYVDIPWPSDGSMIFGDARALPSVLSSTADARALSDHAEAMAEFAIRYDGRRHEYDGYHYDRAEDALVYSNLVSARTRQGRAPREAAAVQMLPVPLPLPEPSDGDRRLMEALDIVFDAGVYRFRDQCYECLADAVTDATRRARQPEDDGGR